ncbi:hypothetical protein PLESTB_000946900 [Pleodorina starrii]|uniref:Uncharacterized protein n=1 Tax=Pleodorina starrii TaxID=330485 RepID=A0A9W6BMZ4_9CHLO|nr:hypothetical protein PLESTM_001152100 [Pleodorina starrii]GLC55127.1 hypothetical protein PLESTB_000946900 [Pleodorina starrii]GLC71120.1 hypothetical protein PLESTF_001076600 [Pleodorina starrii]
MRHTRPGSGAQGTTGNAGGSQRNSQRQGHAGNRTQQVPPDSPPRLKQHRSGPSMSAERFLLIVGQLQSRANELWEREQLELQRGAELMVICCSPAPPSPPQALVGPQADDAASSPVYQFDQASMLHAHSHLLHSPSLIPATHNFQSPSWSNDFSAIAASLILPGPHIADTSEEAPGGTLAPCGMGGGINMHASAMQQQHQPQHAHVQQGAGLQQHHHHHQPPWQPLGTLYDIEAHVTFPQGLSCSGNGVTSATARSAKARLLDRLESNGGATGTATARQVQNADPFCCSFTPVADDFLGSPSWARGYGYM